MSSAPVRSGWGVPGLPPASRLRPLLVALAILLALGPLSPPSPAAAATCAVTTLADSGTGSLRAALADAGCDRVTFAAGLTGTIALQTALPAITRDLAIAGPGAGRLAISGGGATRVLAIGAGATVVAVGLTLRDGDAGTGPGGALWIYGGAAVTLADATITASRAAQNYGGGIYAVASALTLIGSTVNGNTTGAGGGGLALAGSTATIRSSTIGGNSSAAFGGGLDLLGSTATLTDSVVGDNDAAMGGGLHLASGSQATLTRSAVTGNRASADGGGLHLQSASAVALANSPLDGNSAAINGGGMLLFGSSALVTNSTVGNNAAGSGGGFHLDGGSLTASGATIAGNAASGDGGGIAMLSGRLGLGNSTVGENRASGDGGGIAFAGTEGYLQSVTIADNVADSDNDGTGRGGGVFRGGASGAFLVESSIVVGNRTGAPTADDCRGAIASVAFNVWGDATNCPSNEAAGDTDLISLGLAPAAVVAPALADNGGPTATYALVAGSPAIDRVPGPGPSCQAIDQRGAPRPVGPACDSGAVEFGAAAAGYCAAFADVPAGHPACPAIAALAGRGVLQGYATVPPTLGPADPVQRAQMSAFLVRALGWYAEPAGPRGFDDFDGLVAELRVASLILANACGTTGESCVAQGYGDGRFGPNDAVSHAQVIAFIVRAFALDPDYGWTPQPGAPQPYGGVPPVHDVEVRTFAHYAGPIPDAPATANGWNAPAPRAWVARVLEQALQGAP